MKRRIALPLLLAFALAGSAFRVAAQTTTVILVRHAEKAAEPAADPPLTAEGEARAKALLDVARDAGVSAVITTQFARTRATAQQVATALSVTPEIVDARGGASHAQDVANAVRRHAGKTVLVVGHSNTVPAIIAALGAKQPTAICDSEYDNLYIVTIAPSGSVGLIHGRYGEPSHSAAGCGAMR